MRFYVVLLATVTLFARISAVSTTADANVISSGFLVDSPSGSYHDSPAARMLRSYRTQDKEERAVSAPTASKFAEWLLSPKVAGAKKLNLADNVRVKKWMYKQKTSDYVFKKLKLDVGLDKVLTNPKLHLYAAYVDLFNKQNPTKKVSILDMFTKTYGDDAVIKLLELGTKDATIMTFTSRLRTELASSWVTSGKSAEEIFTLLTLDKTGYKIFTTPPLNKEISNPTLNLFAAYIDLSNKQNSAMHMTMLDMFSKTYSDNGVAKMIELGMKAPTTEIFASRLQTELLGKWDDNAESAGDVFKILKLDQAGIDLFATPQLNTWYAHISKGYIRNPEDVMLEVLVSKQGYGYGRLLEIFRHGQRRIDILGDLPMRLETRMVKQWLETRTSPDKVFEILQLNQGLDSLLTNPNLRMWESYRIKLRSQKPEKVPPMMSTITSFYSVKDLSAMLEKAKNVPETAKIATKWQDELTSKIKRRR
ncbi:hypothetical protein PI125_g24386 [Phytophthora idaei]|nr:hypothetical protein PI125_g24386 [Phytophthora idaei]